MGKSPNETQKLGQAVVRDSRGRRFVPVVISVLIVLLVVAGAIFAYQRWLAPNAPSAGDDESSEPQLARAQQVIVDSDNLVATEGVAAAVSALDAQISAAATDQEKAELYQAKYMVLFNAQAQGLEGGDINAAIEAALQVEALKPTASSAGGLATLYEMTGNTAEALKYYELRAERTSDEEKQRFPDDFASLEAKIRQLREQQ